MSVCTHCLRAKAAALLSGAAEHLVAQLFASHENISGRIGIAAERGLQPGEPFGTIHIKHKGRRLATDGVDNQRGQVAVRCLSDAERIAGRGIYYPPCPCIRAVMRIEGRFPLISASYLEPLKEYAEREKLTVAGDPVSHTFLSINRNGGGIRYRVMWLPVAEA